VTRFTWDEGKRQSNLEKHGIDFNEAKEIWSGPIVRLAKRRQSKERRFLIIGKIGSDFVAVVYTDRGGSKRLISARPANRTERADYERAIG
jgi:uncharacterized DUF497 family protein